MDKEKSTRRKPSMRNEANGKVEKPASKSDATRARIIEAAARVFAERGYGHSRLTDIADAADAHAGGIYYYFSSRERLVEEVLAISTRRTIDAVNAELAALPPGASARDQVRAAIVGQLREIMSPLAYTTAFLKIYTQVPDTIKDQHRSILREFFDLWRRIIRAGQVEGSIRSDLDAAVIRLVIVGSIQWSVEWARAGTSSPEHLADQISAMFIEGIGAKAGHTLETATT